MEKRLFNKLIKKQMLLYGFEKNDRLNYSKLSSDGTAKLVVRVPDGKMGFIIGAQFPNFGKYTGIISNCIMKNYEYEILLCFPDVHNYSETDIVDAVNTVITGINPYLSNGKQQIKENIENWCFGAFSDKERNEVLNYFGLPIMDMYSDEYMALNIERIKRGGFILISTQEYMNHKAYYDKYLNHDCYFSFDKKDTHVMIRAKSNRSER